VDIIKAAKLMQEEKKITSINLALVLIHDTLLSDGGIQAGDGPIKQAIIRHKTRLHSELQKIKVKRGVKSNADLASIGDQRAGLWIRNIFVRMMMSCLYAARIPRYVRINTLAWTIEEAIQSFLTCGFELSGPFDSRSAF
jgi:25S rRNA (cytosine2278-C5)-methyltransferase